MKTTTRKPPAQQSVEVMEAGEVTEIVNMEAGSEQNVGVDDDIIDLSTTTNNYKRTTANRVSLRRLGGVIRKEFYLSKPFKLALADDEPKLVKYVLSNPEDRDALEICHFPEMKIRRFELHSLTPHKQLCSTITDAFAHLLNREDIKKNGKVTRFCFETSCAVENGVKGEEVDKLDDNQKKKLCTNFDKLVHLDYLQGVSWEACEYVFFPVHGGEIQVSQIKPSKKCHRIELRQIKMSKKFCINTTSILQI